MKIIIAAFLFILSLFLIGQNLDKPFWGEHDWNGARYGNIARNFLRYGIIDLQFAQIENSGSVTDRQFEYFTHYPPLLPILISISYMFFGVSEWSTRFIPLLATSGSIVLIFLIGKKLYDTKTAFLAAILALIIPINLYFGKTPVHEPLVVFFILLSFFAYLRQFKILLFLSLIAAHLTTWAGFFLIPAITAVAIFTKDKKDFVKIIPYWLIPLTIFSFYIVFIYLHTGSLFGGDLLGALFQRSSLLKEVQPTDFNLVNYLSKLRLWSFSLYSATLTILVGIWLIVSIKRKFSESDVKLLILGLFGVIYLIVFPNAAFIHNYLVMYLIPFFVLSGARVIGRFPFLLSLVILLVIFLERKPFLDALNKSDADRLAVEVGKAINRETKFTDTVLVSPVGFSYSADKFLRFYSDRKIKYGNGGNDWDVKVPVDQENGKFEIINKRSQ